MESDTGPLRRAWAVCFGTLVLAAALCGAGAAGALEQYRWSGIERVVSIGDVHGDYADLVAMMRRVGLVDEAARWTGGRAHFVLTGDFLDRGAESRRVIELLMRLERESAAAGGAVHVLVGNHEVMNLLGDLRDVSPFEYLAYAPDESGEERARRFEEYRSRSGNRRRPLEDVEREFQERFPPGYFAHRALLGPEGRYGKWLLGKPALIVINDTAYLHGGISRAFARDDAAAINARIREAMADYIEAWQELAARDIIPFDMPFAERPARVSEALSGAIGYGERFLRVDRAEELNAESPFWYRGTALCHEWTEGETLRQGLASLGARQMVVGHTFVATARIVSRFDRRLIKADTGLNRAVYGGRASALILENGELHARYLDDQGAPVPVEREPIFAGSVGLRVPDGALLETLSTGTPVSNTESGNGTRQLRFRRDRANIGARFLPELTPEHRREVAAFRVDRALGLGFVPATVIREIDGQQGVLQFIPANAITRRQARQQRLSPAGFCSEESQLQIVSLFDALIGLEDRDPRGVLYDIYDWRITIRDHGEAFGGKRDLRLRLPGWAERSEELRRSVAAVDREQLRRELAELLPPESIEALLARLEALAARIGAGGR